MTGGRIAVVAVAVAVAVAVVLTTAWVRGGPEGLEPASESPVLLAAGDIGDCDTDGDEATARLLDAQPDAIVATLGDNAYPDGTIEDFLRCYGPSWGRSKNRTRPASGNHEHVTEDAAGYFEYFGPAAGEFDRYYYSYDIGTWHVVVLNSDCWRVDGCEPGDPQLQWLRQDLADNPAPCTLAYWHRPPFSSGRYGDEEATGRVRPMWEVAHDLGVDVVLTGHEHSYERFAPMDRRGEPSEGGLPLFVVGTGGADLRSFDNPGLPSTEVRNDDTWGVLEMTLHAAGYEWEFLPVEGGTFTDSGSGSCR